MSTATSNLDDLQLSDEERAAEAEAESAHEARMAARRAELADLDDEALEALSAGDDTPTIDVNLADQLLESRAAARAAQAELDAEDAPAEEPAGEAPSPANPEQVAELEQEAGKAVGDMPPKEPETAVVPPDRIVLRHETSAPKWAGKQPGRCVITLKEVKFEIDGGFRAGERFRFAGEALVTFEGKRDKLDKDTKTPVEAVQVHEAVVLDFELVEE